MYIRRDYKDNMAGDSVQLEKTREYLIKGGIDVEVSSDSRAKLEKYDLIHLFNTIRIEDTFQFYTNAKKQNKKIVISPIYWNYIKYIEVNKKTESLHFKWYQQNVLRKEVLENADLVLPSSLIEMKEIQKVLNINFPYMIIPNGVDKIFEEGKINDFYKSYKLEEYILSVGRISPHKNQLALCKITGKLKIPLILVGPINDMTYYYECLKQNKEVIYVPKVNHHELSNFYKAARAHVLVSWYEIPGLVNLEAGLAGCNMITTEEGSTKEYLKDYVEYTTFSNLKDIEKKVIKVMASEKNKDLKEHIKNHYLWEMVIKKLINAYESIM